MGNEKGWWARQVASGGVQGIVFHITTTYGIPVGVPLMTGVAGWLGGFQWFYIIIGVTFATAMVFHGLVKWDEWQSKGVEHQIAFRSVRFGKEIHGKGITIGLEMVSSASFPLDFEVSELMVKLGDKVPQEEHRAGQILTIPPKGIVVHDSHAIKIDNPPRPGTY